MIRTIQGLDYFVHSPSTFELLSVDKRHAQDKAARVFVYFDGGGWAISYESPERPVPVIRPFHSKEAAFELLADRRERVQACK